MQVDTIRPEITMRMNYLQDGVPHSQTLKVILVEDSVSIVVVHVPERSELLGAFGLIKRVSPDNEFNSVSPAVGHFENEERKSLVRRQTERSPEPN